VPQLVLPVHIEYACLSPGSGGVARLRPRMGSA